MDVTTRFIMAGTLKTGMTGLHLQKRLQTFLQVKLKEIRCRQRKYVIKLYPELLRELEKTLLFWRFSLL
jgi:hypothetical protein